MYRENAGYRSASVAVKGQMISALDLKRLHAGRFEPGSEQHVTSSMRGT